MKKHKKQLWLALGALGAVTAAGSSTAAVPERIGVTSQLNPAVKGELSNQASRVLFVGNDIFRDEVIRTGDTGQVHLMFLDQSSLTMGPKSELVLDRFVYDPATNQGDLSISATRGILRFVGGALSKRNKVTIKTPVGNLGIRGAVTLIDIGGDGGDTIACIEYGLELTGTIPETGISKSTGEHEQCIVLSPDGRIRKEPISLEKLNKMTDALQGPYTDHPPDIKSLMLPENYGRWMRELAGKDLDDRMQDDEDLSIDIFNQSIDSIAS